MVFCHTQGGGPRGDGKRPHFPPTWLPGYEAEVLINPAGENFRNILLTNILVWRELKQLSFTDSHTVDTALVVHHKKPNLKK